MNQYSAEVHCKGEREREREREPCVLWKPHRKFVALNNLQHIVQFKDEKSVESVLSAVWKVPVICCCSCGIG